MVILSITLWLPTYMGQSLIRCNNLLSARYAIRLLFAPDNHPLQEYHSLTSRMMQQPWLDRRSESPQTTGTCYPFLNHLLALITRYLKAGEILENIHITRPVSTPTFPINLTPIEDPADGRKKHQEYLNKQIPGTVLLYTDGSKCKRGGCGSALSIFEQNGNQTSPIKAFGSCCIGGKAEVYDAELHAIQEGLHEITLQDWNSRDILVCVDNQAALITLTSGNPTGSEYAHHTLQLISKLQQMGWTIKGLWTPAHCGIPGNEHADTLAKLSSQKMDVCSHTQVTKSWLQAKVKQQIATDWNNQHPQEPSFPIKIPTKFPKDLQYLGPATCRALFCLQSETRPSDPFPNELPEQCSCGGTRTSGHLLLECPILADAQKNLISHIQPSNPTTTSQTLDPPPNTIFNNSYAPAIISFMKRTGLGFTRYVRDKSSDNLSENKDIDVGPIGSLSLDLDI